MKNLTKDLHVVEGIIGYEFKEKDLLIQAFKRRSYSVENGGANNETLEMLGDKILSYIVILIIIKRYGYKTTKPTEFIMNLYNDEQALSNVVKKLVNKKMLASRITLLSLHEYLIMGKGDIKLNREQEDSVKEDLCESLLAAIAIDSNFNQDILMRVVSKLLDIDKFLNENNKITTDFVSLIQIWQQDKTKTLPMYEYSSGDDGTNYCRLTLNNGLKKWAFDASGKSKAEARMNVSKIAYDYLVTHQLLHTMKDEIKLEINEENAINILQELSQKSFISEPIYEFNDQPILDINGKEVWVCTCIVNSEKIRYTIKTNNKKLSKKKAAYQVLIQLLN